MRTLCLVVLAACGSAPIPSAAPAPAAPPPAHAWPATRAAAVVETVHGQRIVDPYRWLEDGKAPEVRAWMATQDRYARDQLAKSPHRAEIARRLTQLSYFDSVGAPTTAGGRLFYERKHADKEQQILYWREGAAGAEHVLLDPTQWSRDGSTSLSAWWPSRDGQTVVYAVAAHNADEAALHVVDVATGAARPDVIEGVRFSNPEWTPDSRGFYYTWLPPVSDKVSVAERTGFTELRYHQLGTPPATDPTLFPATHDAEATMEARLSRDGRWLSVTLGHGWTASDVYVRDLRAPGAAWTPLVVGSDHVFSLTVWRDQFYVYSDDGGPRGRFYRVDPSHLDRASWREIVPQADAAVQWWFIAGDHLMICYLRNAATEIELHALDGALLKKLALPLGTVDGFAGEPDDDTVYLAFNSATEPSVVYQVAVGGPALGDLRVWARTALGALDPAQVVTEQVTYASRDGTKIPMVLTYKKGIARDGTTPTILTGYGGFGVTVSPQFDAKALAWIERGGVWASANLRGGGEFGEDWHHAGMLDKKQNVFDDFIAAAEYLIAARWTSPAHLAIRGNSNGGLLVGAAMTQRPDLFKAVACGVPLLDMLRYHRFGLGKLWVPEYGSADDAAQFKALYAYSPYRVAVDAGKRAYPTVVFDSAAEDDRVDPMHARKLAALLQADQTGDGAILLRIEANAGHHGADVVKQQIEQAADWLGLFDRLLR